jgi:hypothetical protein
MARPLFKLSKVGEHKSKGFHGVAGFYANTRRVMYVTSILGAPENKTRLAAAIRTA